MISGGAVRSREVLRRALLLPLLALKRTAIGGQAVIEGVMMRGVDHWALAVRKPDQSIGMHEYDLVPWARRYPVLKAPLLRGVVALAEALVIGMKAITISANESLGEEQQELSKKEMGITFAVAIVLAVGLFFLAPFYLTNLLSDRLGKGVVFWLIEGVVRVSIFIASLAVVTLLPDLRRVFEYHGAEHMAIHALEHDKPLTPEGCRGFRTLHVRCGTSFLLIVMVVSIFIFALVGRPVWYLFIASRVILIPLIAGISYEITRWAGRHEENGFVKVIMAPGLALQRMTTRQPDDSQIEVAVAALEKVLELEPPDAPPVKDVEILA